MLLLDVLGTLVHEPFYVELPAFFGLTVDELIEAKDPTVWLEYELGRIEEEELFRRFFRDGREYDHRAMKACMVDAFHWLEGMEGLVAALHAAGHEMHAISNYSEWYRHIDERLALSRFLTMDFISCNLGVRKPDPGAWRIPLERLDVPPERCLFVDDREVNCEAARELGIETIHFTGAEQLRRELTGRGLL
ncbi:MAG: HAD family phosphatase [Planctomycetota bacterium]|nr:HAD family phosphatase [Planctomycetota bacterium]